MEEVKKEVVLEVDTERAETSVKEIRKEIKRLQDEMANLDEGSQAFLECANKAGTLKHKIDEIKESTSAASADLGDMLQNATKSAAGVVGAFQSVKGAMTLLGVESENVEKAIQKMQASMAIIQGLQAVDDGIKGFDKLTTAIATQVFGMQEEIAVKEQDVVVTEQLALANESTALATQELAVANKANATATKTGTKALGGFKKALIATGIGAIIVLIGELIAHFDDLDKLTGGKLSKTMSGLSGVLGNLGNEAKALGKLVLESLLLPFKNVMAAAKGLGRIIKAVFKGDFDSIGDIARETGDEIKQNFADVGEAAKGVGEAFSEGFEQGVAEDEAKKRAKAWEEYTKKRNEQLDLERAKAEATITDEEKLNEELIRIETERLKLQKKGSKEYWEQLKKINDLRKKNEEETTEEEVEKEKKAYELKLEQAKRNHTQNLLLLQEEGLEYEEYIKRKKELEEQFKNAKIAAIKATLADTTNLTQEEIDKLKEQLASLQEVAKPEKVETTTDSGTTLAQGVANSMDTMKSALQELGADSAWGDVMGQIQGIAANWDDLSTKFSASTESAVGAAGLMAAAGFQAISSIMTSLADEQDTTTREGFEQSKKYQIAAATMSMLAGISSAWASSMMLPSPANVIMGGILSALMGVTGGLQISKIKATTFDGGGSTSAGSSGGYNISNSVLSQAVTPSTTQAMLTGISSEASLEDTRVYVVESDITSSQSKVAVAESEATY